MTLMHHWYPSRVKRVFLGPCSWHACARLAILLVSVAHVHSICGLAGRLCVELLDLEAPLVALAMRFISLQAY